MRKIIFLLFMIFTLTSCKSYEVSADQERFILNDKGIERFYIIKYINENKKQNLIGSLPTIIINRIDEELIIRSDAKTVEKINLFRKDIQRIKIIPIDNSLQLFGSAGKDGIVEIFTY